MSSIINLKIDVTKLTKDKLFKGQKGTYSDLTVSEYMDGENQYGETHCVYEKQSKEEREAGVDKVYVGSGKEFTFGGNGATKVTATPEPATADMDDEDIPF